MHHPRRADDISEMLPRRRHLRVIDQVQHRGREEFSVGGVFFDFMVGEVVDGLGVDEMGCEEGD